MIVGVGPAFENGASPDGACLLDIAPTILHLLGVPVPDDMDGRVLTELLKPELRNSMQLQESVSSESIGTCSLNAEEEALIQQRLADLGYL